MSSSNKYLPSESRESLNKQKNKVKNRYSTNLDDSESDSMYVKGKGRKDELKYAKYGKKVMGK